MHMIQDIRRWEHEAMLCSSKLFHSSTFWAIVAIGIVLAMMLLTVIFAPKGSMPVNYDYHYPFGPIH